MNDANAKAATPKAVTPCHTRDSTFRFPTAELALPALELAVAEEDEVTEVEELVVVELKVLERTVEVTEVVIFAPEEGEALALLLPAESVPFR